MTRTRTQTRRWVGGWFLAAVLALGSVALLVRAGQDPTVPPPLAVTPPFLAGLLTPLLPAAVLVLLAMITAVAVGGTPGDPPAPAHRALGPALAAAAGGVLGLLALALSFDAGRAISLSGEDYSSGRHRFGAAIPWIVAGAAVLILLRSLYLVARPRTTDPVAAPGHGWARTAWFGGWVLAGAMLVVAGTGPFRLPYTALDGAPVRDVQPLGGVLGSGGGLSWWGAYLLGLTVMLAAALSLGAALRVAVVRSAAAHRAAARIGYTLIAEAAVLLLLTTALERTDRPVLQMLHSWYWRTFVVLDGRSTGRPALWLVVAVAAIIAVAVPSLVHTARRLSRARTAP